MKRTMIKTLNTHKECYFGEFHTVVKLLQPENFDTEIIDNVFEKITV